MTLIYEESDNIFPDLLTILLDSLKKKNKEVFQVTMNVVQSFLRSILSRSMISCYNLENF